MNKFIWYILAIATYAVLCYAIITWCTIIEVKVYEYSQCSMVDNVVGCIVAAMMTDRLYRWMKWM